jgi:hypothetical protein
MVQQPAFSAYCFETLPDGTSNNDLCGLASGNFTKTFSSLMAPQDAILSGFGLIIFWGGIIGIIWFKTERIDIVGIIGLVIAGTMTATFSAHAIGIGLTLLFVDLGILAWQLIRQRVTIFS